jgi:amino acid transporter
VKSNRWNSSNWVTIIFLIFALLLLVNGVTGILVGKVEIGFFSKYDIVEVRTGYYSLFFGLFCLAVVFLRISNKSKKGKDLD